MPRPRQPEFLSPRQLSERDPFWAFARAMLRYRAQILGAVALAVLSALTLSAGLASVAPVLKSILGDRQDLQALAQGLNARLTRGAEVFAPLALLRLPDSAVQALPTDPFLSLVWIMAGLAVLTIVGALATFGQQYAALTVVNSTVAAVRRRAFRAVLLAPLRTTLSRGASDSISRIINDSSTLANGLHVLLGKTLLQAAKGLGAFVMAFVFEWKVSLVALLVTPVLYTVIRRLGKRIRRASNAAMEGQAELFGVSMQSLQGLRVVKSYNAQAYEAGRFQRVNRRMLADLNRVRTARAIASPLTEVLTLLALGGMVLVVAKAVFAGRVEPTNIILAIVCLGIAGEAARPLTALAHDIQTSTPAAQRLRELICLAPEALQDSSTSRPLKLARHARSLEFRDVTVLHPGREATPAIDAVRLTIAHGERVAFVGPNGSGKTTLLSLINRMYDPDAGSVLIDGIDVRSVDLRSLRAQVGVVSQETVLFKGTIRENIAYGALGAMRPLSGRTDEEDPVIAAARKARAHDFIVQLPQGYDTPVSEQGTSLSGGQRQRIAIARAVLRDPAILILDEATSMIDAESEAMITQAIQDFSRGRTCLIVAHRLSTVVHCDRIVVLDAGRIVDIGTHADLMKRCGLYQALARNQLVGA